MSRTNLPDSPQAVARVLVCAASHLHLAALQHVKRHGAMWPDTTRDARVLTERRLVTCDLRRWRCVESSVELTRVGQALLYLLERERHDGSSATCA